MRECGEKFAAGAKEHRTEAPYEFQGDPVAEYEAEQIDSHNYLDVIYTKGIISTQEWISKQRQHYEQWLWARSLRHRAGRES